VATSIARGQTMSLDVVDLRLGDVRLGDWRQVLADVECDLLLTDPPYSARTHEGQRSVGENGQEATLAGLYRSIDETYCYELVEAWKKRVRSWWVIFGDHVTWTWWTGALRDAGFYTFAPVLWIRHPGPRMSGDGPVTGAEFLAVARRRSQELMGWGSLPGWYECPTVRGADREPDLIGQKPVNLMRALVRDYSRRDWTICDPHAGTGTTLFAGRQEHRRTIGAEIDPRTFEIAKARLVKPWTPDLFGGGR
jgi:DNA modification methylase